MSHSLSGISTTVLRRIYLYISALPTWDLNMGERWINNVRIDEFDSSWNEIMHLQADYEVPAIRLDIA